MKSGVSYEGTREKKLGIALGGLGTATLEIGRDGAFQNIRVQNDWSIQGGIKDTPPATFLSVHARTKDGPGVGRIMQLDAPLDFEPIAGLTYTGRFPFVEIAYQDKDLPCEVTMEAFSPFVPLDAESSSLPLVFFTFRLRNPGKKPIVASAAISWANNIAAESWKNGWQSEGNRNCLIDDPAPAILMDTERDEIAGSEYLLAALPAEGVTYSAVRDWWIGYLGHRRHGEEARAVQEAAMVRWRTFLEKGVLPEDMYFDDGLGEHSHHMPVGAMAGEVELAPGEEKEVRFALVWYFPYHYDRNGRTRGVDFLGHQYATRFPNGTRDVAEWAFPQRDSLRERSESWRALIEESSLPPQTRLLMTETLYLLPRISWWLADGRFVFYESIDCPRIHTTILDLYIVPVMAALFPELHASSARVVAAAQLESGEIPSTQGFSSIIHHEYRVFNPGDASVFPITTIWEMLWGGDHQFVTDLYPVIKKVLMWGKNTLDHNDDGLPDVHGIDQGWDTFPMFGASSYMADSFMGALRGGAKIARYLGDTEFAEWCDNAFQQASETVEQTLWNGRYYNLFRNAATGETSEICFLDQLTYGTMPAGILGFGDVHPQERVQRALASLWELNINTAKVVSRTGSHPDGRPADSTIHSEQAGGSSQSNCFTPVATAPAMAVAIQHGMVKEAMAVVEEMSEVIIKQGQDPWRGLLMFSSETGDWFYGEHYSDCLIVWTVMHALLGVHVDMLERRLTFAPPQIPVKLPVFGRFYHGQVEFAEKAGAVTLTLTSASEKPALLDTLEIRLPEGTAVKAGRLTKGRATKVEECDGATVLTDAVVPPHGVLTVQWDAKK
jgi:uncharacterized protein (DUF608 family)